VQTVHCTKRGKIVKNKLLFSGAGALKGKGGGVCSRPEAVFKEKHGVWDPMPELTIIHLILWSTPQSVIHPHYKGKGVKGDCICMLISKTGILVNRKYREVG
jgi:hypothetical protein